MELTELVTACNKWQRILRLQDWNIELAKDIYGNTNGHAVSYSSLNFKTCRITIADVNTIPTVFFGSRDEEKSLVHELLHLNLLSLDEDVKKDQSKGSELEFMVDNLANILVDQQRAIEAQQEKIGVLEALLDAKN